MLRLDIVFYEVGGLSVRAAVLSKSKRILLVFFAVVVVSPLSSSSLVYFICFSQIHRKAKSYCNEKNWRYCLESERTVNGQNTDSNKQVTMKKGTSNEKKDTLRTWWDYKMLQKQSNELKYLMVYFVCACGYWFWPQIYTYTLVYAHPVIRAHCTSGTHTDTLPFSWNRKLD